MEVVFYLTLRRREAEYAEECFWKMWGQTLSLYLIINHFSIKIEQIGCYCVNEN